MSNRTKIYLFFITIITLVKEIARE